MISDVDPRCKNGFPLLIDPRFRGDDTINIKKKSVIPARLAEHVEAGESGNPEVEVIKCYF